MATNVAALQARLRSGEFNDGDLDEAVALVKGLRDGTISGSDLTVAPAAAPAAQAAAPEEDAAVTDPPGAGPLAKAVSVPDAGELREELAANPDASRAINAVPALAALVKSFEGIATSLQAQEEARLQDSQVIKGLAARVVQLEGMVQKGLGIAAAPAAPVTPARDERAQVGADTADAILKALNAAGFGELVAKVGQLDEAVNRRPHSGNPTPSQLAAARMAKSLADGGRGQELDKTSCIGLIQKSLSMGRIDEDQAGEALARLDYVPQLQQMGQQTTYADIVRQVDKKTLEEFGG